MAATSESADIGSVTGNFFTVFQSFFDFITANPLIAFACFAPIVVFTITLIVKAVR